MTTFNRPELAIIPSEDITNLITEFPTEESDLTLTTIISIIGIISVIVTIKRRKKL